MLNYSKLKKIFIISLILITFISCDDNDDWIPNIRVNITINLIQLADLGILQTRYWPGGVNDLIIFRLEDTEFNVYDRTCSYQPSNNCKVEVEAAELYAECPCCGSEFNLLDGMIRKGPAKRPLKQYRAIVSGSFLNITN